MENKKLTADEKIERLWRGTLLVWSQKLNSYCWQWTGAIRNHGGYGQAPSAKGILGERLAHRAAYTVTRGPIPKKKQLDHLCRNRLCINPEHLEVVTGAVNSQRAITTKLTPEQVRTVRVSAVSARKEASRLGVSQSTIFAIRNGQNWNTVV